VFALGWSPCIGPALAVVINLGLNEGTALRGGVLGFAYALGLGIPFVIAGLAFTAMNRTVGLLRRHQVAVLRIGGLMMVAVGVLLVTGLWDQLMARLTVWVGTFETVI
jgi:cytochrome c-type biogenesis protein